MTSSDCDPHKSILKMVRCCVRLMNQQVEQQSAPFESTIFFQSGFNTGPFRLPIYIFKSEALY